ncbi:Serine/threonine protein kinase [Handroanthus impetiginosus]|uniref:Serine/threonine protein kinase n=1 Tax=Handroanthus impetiginosus TaxID=429701 RepID=A0A2G9G2I7_9LAMI|nr:Serine/threonine protein kinase [Handroanthus impetiginosus]
METENGDAKSKMEDYAAIEQIGRGAFGAAFLVLHKNENKKYVLKKIRLSKQTEKFKRAAYQEMDLLAKLRHPYILEYKDAWVDRGSCICILTNYCEGGNISEIMRKARGAYFPEEKICKWLTQLLLAIDYLHSNRVLHRNLKLSNIFVTKENDIRLGDSGLAKLLNEEGLPSSVAGTPKYMCPDLLADTPYGYKSDIWSLGCCMFEIAAHEQAFRAPDMSGLINKINRSLISPLPIVYSSTLKQIIKSMLRKSPEHRPTAAELLRHPHLQPFLLRCHNPSTVFLPVTSPSPSNTNEKTRKPSPSSSVVGNDHREREANLKQRELLPLFDESIHMQYPNLLDGDALIEDQLETKRVDPTSYSGKISQDSEDSKSGDATCHGDDQDNFDSSSLKQSINMIDDSSTLPSNAPLSEEQEEFSNKRMIMSENAEEMGIKTEDTTLNENAPLAKDKVRSEADAEPRISAGMEENTEEAKITVKIEEDIPSELTKNEKGSDNLSSNTEAANTGDESKNWANPGQQRADALESLLELCARLLKQEKFDELSRVLKPFGEEAVSSRETAIWLTKSLMNAQKFAKDQS